MGTYVTVPSTHTVTVTVEIAMPTPGASIKFPHGVVSVAGSFIQIRAKGRFTRQNVTPKNYPGPGLGDFFGFGTRAFIG